MAKRLRGYEPKQARDTWINLLLESRFVTPLVNAIKILQLKHLIYRHLSLSIFLLLQRYFAERNRRREWRSRRRKKGNGCYWKRLVAMMSLIRIKQDGRETKSKIDSLMRKRDRNDECQVPVVACDLMASQIRQAWLVARAILPDRQVFVLVAIFLDLRHKTPNANTHQKNLYKIIFIPPRMVQFTIRLAWHLKILD